MQSHKDIIAYSLNIFYIKLVSHKIRPELSDSQSNNSLFCKTTSI